MSSRHVAGTFPVHNTFLYYRPDIPLLLGLYEAVHLNRNFVLALTTSHASSRIGSSHSLNDLPEEVPPAIPRASDGMFCTCHR